MEIYGLAAISGLLLALLFLIWPQPSGLTLNKLLPRTGVQSLAAVRRGRVLVRGVVRQADDLLEAPLSGGLVVGYRLIVDRSDGAHHWSRVLDLVEVADFLLEDEGVLARVRGEDAVLLLSQAVSAPPVSSTRFPQAILDLLTHHCQYQPEPHQSSLFRWIELRIVDGNEVHVAGQATVAPDPAGRHMVAGGAYRSPPTELRLSGSSDRPLVISDRDPKDLSALLAVASGGRLFPRR